MGYESSTTESTPVPPFVITGEMARDLPGSAQDFKLKSQRAQAHEEQARNAFDKLVHRRDRFGRSNYDHVRQQGLRERLSHLTQEQFLHELAELTDQWGARGRETRNEVEAVVEVVIKKAQLAHEQGDGSPELQFYKNTFRQFIARGWLRVDQIDFLEREHLIDQNVVVGPQHHQNKENPNLSYFEDPSINPPRRLTENEIAAWAFSPSNLTPQEIKTVWQAFQDRWERGQMSPYERQVLLEHRGVPENLLPIEAIRENWKRGTLKLTEKQIAELAAFDRSIFSRPSPSSSHEWFLTIDPDGYFSLPQKERDLLLEDTLRLQNGSPKGFVSAAHNYYQGKLPRTRVDRRGSVAPLLTKLVPSLHDFPITEYSRPFILYEWQKSLTALFPLSPERSGQQELTQDQQKVMELLGRLERRRRDGQITPLERLLANAAAEHFLPNPERNPINGFERYYFTPGRGNSEALYVKRVLQPLYAHPEKSAVLRGAGEVASGLSLAALIVLIIAFASYQATKDVSPSIRDATKFFTLLISGDRNAQLFTANVLSSTFNHEVEMARQTSLAEQAKLPRTEHATGVSVIGPGSQTYYEFEISDNQGHHKELIQINEDRSPTERKPRTILNSITDTPFRYLGDNRYFSRIVVRQNTANQALNSVDNSDQNVQKEPSKLSTSELVLFGPDELFIGNQMDGRIPIFGRINNSDNNVPKEDQVHFLGWIDEGKNLFLEPDNNNLNSWYGPKTPDSRYYRVHRLPKPGDPWVNETNRVFNKLTHTPAEDIAYAGRLPSLFLNKTTGKHIGSFERNLSFAELENFEPVIPELFYDDEEKQFLLGIGRHPDGSPLFATPFKRGGEWLYALGVRHDVVTSGDRQILDPRFEIGFPDSVSAGFNEVIQEAYRIAQPPGEAPRIEQASTDPEITNVSEINAGWKNAKMLFRHFDKDGNLKYFGVSLEPNSQLLFEADTLGDAETLGNKLRSGSFLSELDVPPTAIIINGESFLIDRDQNENNRLTYSNLFGQQASLDPVNFRTEIIPSGETSHALQLSASVDTERDGPSIGVKSPVSVEPIISSEQGETGAMVMRGR